MLLLGGFLRTVARHLRMVTWQVFASVLLLHCGLSWALMHAVGEVKLTEPVVWLYYYTVTATTVGYGDFSPQSDAGRLVAFLVVLPGGVSLFATLVGEPGVVSPVPELKQAIMALLRQKSARCVVILPTSVANRLTPPGSTTRKATRRPASLCGEKSP